MAENKELTDEDRDKMSIEVLDIPIRVLNALSLKGNIITLGDIRKKIKNLSTIRNIGPKTINKIIKEMEKYYGKTL
jgi:DNA-directed RNA polymerase alpha subunit